MTDAEQLDRLREECQRIEDMPRPSPRDLERWRRCNEQKWKLWEKVEKRKNEIQQQKI